MKRRRKARKRRPRCLYPGCDDHGRRSRGLCVSHYSAAYNYIRLGLVDSWAKLVTLGKAKDLRPPKPQVKYSWFLEKR